MTGARLEIGVDDAGRAAGRTALDAPRAAFEGRARAVLLDGIGAAMVSLTHGRFEAGQDPDGTPWTPVVRAPGETGATPLRLRGHLYDSITHVVRGDSVQIGSALKYAAIHQFGGMIKPKTAKILAFQVGGAAVVAREVTIPARPYLGMGAAGEAAIRDAVADHLDAFMARAGAGDGA